ncbi:MAG: putative RNA uridine N3 methyltransferase [Nitrososphaerota archaeon]
MENPPAVLIPYSYAYDAPSLREATHRIGFLGRVLAAFRIERLILYRDREGGVYRRNALLVKELLDYLCTAPYLRKRLYSLRPSLRYAGLLPPLNIPTHPDVEDIRVEGIHYRQALVVSSGDTSLLDAGLRREVRLGRRLGRGSRVVLRVEVGGGGRRFKLVPSSSLEVYDGFRTSLAEGLEEALRGYDVKIATSRYGEDAAAELPSLRHLARSGRVCIAFGAYDRGLEEIVGGSGRRLEELFTKVLNTVPGQGVRTVRTEEALAYTLAIWNLHLRS